MLLPVELLEAWTLFVQAARSPTSTLALQLKLLVLRLLYQGWTAWRPILVRAAIVLAVLGLEVLMFHGGLLDFLVSTHVSPPLDMHVSAYGFVSPEPLFLAVDRFVEARGTTPLEFPAPPPCPHVAPPFCVLPPPPGGGGGLTRGVPRSPLPSCGTTFLCTP
jgi:hypothetical protein